ncbi:spore germination protein [Peribacillus sp. SCS-155]|uniref:spore germination protein n=1 Tax=Peribacillus sedimenti TaxID=3115297 RepID=UPI0039065F21
MFKNLLSFLHKKTNKKNNAQKTEKDSSAKNSKVSQTLNKNVALLKKTYNYPDNVDVTFRELTVNKTNQKACIIFVNSLTDKKQLDAHIIKPLLQNMAEKKSVKDIITFDSVSTRQSMKDVITDINKGNAVLLLEDSSYGYVAQCAKPKARSVEKAENEYVLKGPKEAFNETAYTNISLVRRRITNESFMVESIKVSKRSNNEAFLIYLKDLANEQLVSNIRNRLKALNVEHVQSLGILEQYIEERRKSVFPTILYTERPDRVAAFLEEGHIAILMDNSPDALVLPATFWSFFHSPEEHYQRFPVGNFTRLLRIFAVFTTLFSSAIYVAVTTFHQEMIPSDLLLAIAASREKVPLPAFGEVLVMELAFELIREAGLRVPTPLGTTIGIVGALILGQAAVEANIISPLVIIVVALGGVSSFAVSDVNLNYSIRMIKFMFIFSAALFGFYGVTGLFSMGLTYMASIKSFGVPFLAPMTPRYKSSMDTIVRKLLTSERLRPGYLKPKDQVKKGE